MILPYYLRLLGLCFACFFLVNACAASVLSLLSPYLASFSRRLRPKVAARLTFAALVLPACLAAASVLFFCIPSYLWFEASRNDEKVGALFLITALLGFVCSAQSVVRVFFAIYKTARWKKICLPAAASAPQSQFVVADVAQPIVALVGLVRPRIIVSKTVLAGLDASEIEAIVRHEMAHRDSLDNWKRLALVLAPHPLPFLPANSILSKAFYRCCEWSADDDATQSDHLRAINLASAMVRVARLKNLQSFAVASSLLQEGDDLRLRVQRLLQSEPVLLPVAPHRHRGVLIALFAVSALLYVSPNLLLTAHGILEHLVH